MKPLSLIGFFMMFQLAIFAQSGSQGQLLVNQDERVDSLMADYLTIRMKFMENPDNKGIPGYRIQIFFDSGSNSSDRARLARDGFLLIYPDVPAYVNWKAPNYRVRVGDYRTRLEAENALQLIIIDYPNAWVIKDEINFPQMN